jgi:hypothetical protein
MVLKIALVLNSSPCDHDHDGPPNMCVSLFLIISFPMGHRTANNNYYPAMM